MGQKTSLVLSCKNAYRVFNIFKLVLWFISSSFIHLVISPQ